VVRELNDPAISRVKIATETTVVAHESEPIRRSIEVEYWVVDNDGRLVEPGELVDASAGSEREFVEPLLEIKTTPCETTAELRDELFDRVESVVRRADELDRGLVPLATPIHAGEIPDRASDRTRIQDRVIGDDFEYVRHCAGTHIHVEQQPGREIDQLNALIALDPALALANSSPYFRGRNLAVGARSKLYRWMAYDGVPHQGRLWPYVDDTEEWTRRLERRYEEFVTAAIEAGADRATIESNFDPESAVWTPVQFRDTFGTVEWRSPDAALPSQIIQLADRVAEIVGHLGDADVRIEGRTGSVTEDAIVLPEFDAVIEYVTAAIREGVASDAVWSYLDRMGFDIAAYEPVSHEIDGLGPVSPRMRAVFDSTTPSASSGTFDRPVRSPATDDPRRTIGRRHLASIDSSGRSLGNVLLCGYRRSLHGDSHRRDDHRDRREQGTRTLDGAAPLGTRAEHRPRGPQRRRPRGRGRRGGRRDAGRAGGRSRRRCRRPRRRVDARPLRRDRYADQQRRDLGAQFRRGAPVTGRDERRRVGPDYGRQRERCLSVHETRPRGNAREGQKSGQIINVSSGLGRYAIPDAAAYITSKWGLEGFTQGVALEVEDDGINVNAIDPGGRVNTRIWEHLPDDERQEILQPDVMDDAAALLAAQGPDGVTGESMTAAEWEDRLE